MAFTIPNFEPYQAANPLAAALSGYTQGQDLQSKIAEARARAGYLGQQAQTEQFKRDNPYLLASGDTQLMMYAKALRDQQQKQKPQPNAPERGGGGDFSPQKQQLASALASNAPAQGAQDLDLNDPTSWINIKLNPAARVQAATQLAEQSGRAKGIEAEGAKLGEIRANDIHDLDTQYGQILQSEAPITHLIDLVNGPEFMNLKREFPFYQDRQLQALSKLGTPEEQKAIGDFLSSASNTVASAVQQFKGSALEKEFDLEDQMNVSPNDTWNSMVGKLESIKTYKELIKQRNRAAVKLMQEKHINKGDALEQADKLVDGDKIRKQIRDELKPKRTIDGITYHKVNGKWLPVLGDNNA